mmetsp:Transcript_56049/g.67567  ORF Transcript_56049/g.67567 Transcript_56049/m.67567 type:complete len:81 (-) Transcript_56049:800-1042(-)
MIPDSLSISSCSLLHLYSSISAFSFDPSNVTPWFEIFFTASIFFCYNIQCVRANVTNMSQNYIKVNKSSHSNDDSNCFTD